LSTANRPQGDPKRRRRRRPVRPEWENRRGSASRFKAPRLRQSLEARFKIERCDNFDHRDAPKAHNTETPQFDEAGDPFWRARHKRIAPAFKNDRIVGDQGRPSPRAVLHDIERQE
jgi:hypothetical protein